MILREFEELQWLATNKKFIAHLKGVDEELKSKTGISIKDIIDYLEEDNLFMASAPCSERLFLGKYSFSHFDPDPDETWKVWIDDKEDYSILTIASFFYKRKKRKFATWSFLWSLQQNFDEAKKIYLRILAKGEPSCLSIISENSSS